MYGILFPTIEHAFAAAKLNPNGGVHTRAEVLAEMKVIADTPKPNDAKRLGRRRIWNAKPFMRSDWDGIKNNLIRVLIRRKFENPELRAKLLATGDVDLFELNTWGDDIWGVVEKNGDLLGDNMLGQLLMQVRAEIRADQSSSP
jgi:ribA/ribD-fused uncharacterized protein